MTQRTANIETEDQSALLQKACQGDIDAMGKVLRVNRAAFADFKLRLAWNRIMVHGSHAQCEQLMRAIGKPATQERLPDPHHVYRDMHAAIGT